MLTASENKLLTQTAELGRRFLRTESHMAGNLIKIARDKLFVKVERTSIVDYIVEELKIDSDYAYVLSAVINKSLKFPYLASALIECRLTVGKATRISGTLTHENVEHLVEFARSHTCKQINAHVAKFKSKVEPRETLKQIAEDQYRLTSHFDTEEVNDMDRARAIQAQKRKPSKRRDVIAISIKEFVERHDKVKKAARRRNSVQTETGDGRNLKAWVKHAVYQRSQGSCEFIGSDQKRCTRDRHVEIHHIQPLSMGGSNDPGNLRLLCWAHHDLIHQLNLFPEEDQIAAT